MVSYYYYRVRMQPSYCVDRVPEDYYSAVLKKLIANGYDRCGHRV